MHTTIKQPLITSFHNQHQSPPPFSDDDQQLDALSLRDLPIIPPTTSTTVDHQTTNLSRRSSSSDFFFEFLINNDDDLITSTADDVILHGRLLPYAPPPPRRSLSLSSVAARLTRPQLTESPSESTSLPAIRPSRSLNYRKLHRNHHHHHRSKPKAKLNRDVMSNYNSDKVPAKFPWYWLAFGLPVKMAAEMELKDIKNRQFRREYAPAATGVFSGDRRCSSASWKFLSVLSCKSHATIDVSNTAPLRTSLM